MANRTHASAGMKIRINSPSLAWSSDASALPQGVNWRIASALAALVAATVGEVDYQIAEQTDGRTRSCQISFRRLYNHLRTGACRRRAVLLVDYCSDSRFRLILIALYRR